LVTIAVPQGTETLALDATARSQAVTLVPPLKLRPVELELRAMMQATAVDLTSAVAIAVIVLVVVPLGNSYLISNDMTCVLIVATKAMSPAMTGPLVFWIVIRFSVNVLVLGSQVRVACPDVLLISVR
jgi:hypothetical protein